jgi:VWFA-related protein
VRAGFALVIVAASILLAQDTPVFRVGTRLVQVDVVVRNKDGPVRGLTRDDFTLLDKGVPQQIAVFSVRTADTPPRASTPPPGVVTNRPPAQGSEPVSLTVILFDRLNTEVGDQGFAREQALKYLRGAARNEHIAIYSLNQTLRVTQEFTNDRDLLIRALERAAGEQSMELTTADIVADGSKNAASFAREFSQLRRVEISTAAFATVARHLSGFPGRKKLVWISAAVPLTFHEEQEHNFRTTNEYKAFNEPFDRASQMLNDANVALYAIDPRGVIAGFDENQTVMNRVASRTGGRAFYATNDIAGSIESSLTDTDVTYTLGFYPSEEKLDDSFHNLTVRVKESRGLDVRYRGGYTAARRRLFTPAQRLGTLNQWMQDPLEATEIAIAAKATPVANRPGFFRVEVKVSAAELELTQQRNGHWVGSFDLGIVPDTTSRLRGLHQTLRVDIKPERMEAVRIDGLLVTNVVQAGNAKGKLFAPKLHVVVMDGAGIKSGSVRIPLPGAR